MGQYYEAILASLLKGLTEDVHRRAVQRRPSALVLYVLIDADHDMVLFSHHLGKLLEPSKVQGSAERPEAIAWLESVTVATNTT